MKKIVYLHGLESKQGGRKVEYLSSKYLTYAPSLQYDNITECFNETLELVKQIQPDLIIGSSMGGYFAELLSTYIDTEVLLLNPATIKYIDTEIPRGSKETKGQVVIGNLDKTINPQLSNHYYSTMDNMEVIVKFYGHRTPYETFITLI